MKKSILLLIAIIILMISGGPEKATAQELVAVRIYPLNGSALKKAEKLKDFYHPKEIIKIFGLNRRISFGMQSCPDSTLAIYLPTFDKDGDRTDCGPAIMLFISNDKWFTHNKPINGKSYCRKESKQQAKIIKKSLKFLARMNLNSPAKI